MSTNGAMQPKSGKDRLIVALDVSDHEQAIALVQELDNVFFFKIGLELIVAGNVLDLIEKLQKGRSEESSIFIDLKVSGDIGNTITRFVRACTTHEIKFITLGGPAEFTINKSEVINTAVMAREGNEYPKILGVPLLSSASFVSPGIDVAALPGVSNDTDYILQKGEALITAGCDGLIVSGNAIKNCKDAFPNATIVSPGIRPTGISTDDHERFTTPGKAIELGSDFLVVGRPILNAQDRREAAQRIIEEIDGVLARNPSFV